MIVVYLKNKSNICRELSVIIRVLFCFFLSAFSCKWVFVLSLIILKMWTFWVLDISLEFLVIYIVVFSLFFVSIYICYRIFNIRKLVYIYRCLNNIIIFVRLNFCCWIKNILFLLIFLFRIIKRWFWFLYKMIFILFFFCII